MIISLLTASSPFVITAVAESASVILRAAAPPGNVFQPHPFCLEPLVRAPRPRGYRDSRASALSPFEDA